MTKRIFRSICSVAIAVFLAAVALIMGVLYSYFSGTQMSQLRLQAGLAAQGVAHEGIDYFDGLDTGDGRITWIGADGAVLYDSAADAAQMENHSAREEVQEALRSGAGDSIRYSTTLMERQLYAALRLDDGTVIRLSCAQYTVLTLLLSMIRPIIIAAAIAAGLSLYLASRLSKRIVKPLNELNPDDPESGAVYEELMPMVNRLRSQQAQLKQQATELQRKRDEFEAATRNMTEGLVLLSERGILLSINRSATKLLGISQYCIGKDILLLNHSYEMQELLRRAQSGEHAEMTLPAESGSYQINASPVVSNGVITGIALLIFDVTDKEKAEQMRREFTANVSHELKTPLHTISGCAELLAGGMVKTEDVAEFAGQIYSEAKRMTALVEDIIGLSHLDEGAADMQREDTDLFALAERTVDSLQPAARAAEVALTLHGGPAPLCGVPQLLTGIVYNLCDNAIKYNNAGGTAEVTVENLPEEVRLTVRDNGIGIPAAQQARIFERFYRVDKSRSKAVGGTGLGLSIVKHAAKLHSAEIELESAPGEGTTVKVHFPKRAV